MDRAREAKRGGRDVALDPEWPEWVVRQGFACVWVQAPSASAAVELAAKRLGHMGGWRTGPDVDQEVFPAAEYRDQANPGDYTRSVITGTPAR